MTDDFQIIDAGNGKYTYSGVFTMASWDCVVCCEPLNTHIRQCVNGHPICKNCAVRLMKSGCPQCRVKGTTRHIIAEHIRDIITRDFVCKLPGCANRAFSAEAALSHAPSQKGEPYVIPTADLPNLDRVCIEDTQPKFKKAAHVMIPLGSRRVHGVVLRNINDPKTYTCGETVEVEYTDLGGLGEKSIVVSAAECTVLNCEDGAEPSSCVHQ